MGDLYTPIEDFLDQTYAAGRAQLAMPGFVQSWDDYIQRRGYLTALADVGAKIKELRNPRPPDTGEIPDILQPENGEQT